MILLKQVIAKASSFSEIQSLCRKSYLDHYCWMQGNCNHHFVIFSDDSSRETVGAVEYSETQGKKFLEMLEVRTNFQNQGYGSAIVRFLQNESTALECVPIEESEKLFRNCGFVRSNGQIWRWEKGEE